MLGSMAFSKPYYLHIILTTTLYQDEIANGLLLLENVKG